MIGDALRDGSEFGIVTAQGATMDVVGCTAIVEEVTHQHEDGRFDIRARGVRRFRTVAVDQSEDLLEASVEFFDDEPALPLAGEEVAALYALALEAAALAGVKIARKPDAADPQPSFRAADLLPLDLSFKQQLNASRSERDRAAKLTEYLQTWVDQEKVKQRTRQISRTNGHGRAH